MAARERSCGWLLRQAHRFALVDKLHGALPRVLEHVERGDLAAYSAVLAAAATGGPPVLHSQQPPRLSDLRPGQQSPQRAHGGDERSVGVAVVYEMGAVLWGEFQPSFSSEARRAPRALQLFAVLIPLQ